MSYNSLATFTNSRAWVTLKRVNSEMEPFKKFIISRLICSTLSFEMFINDSWCKNISFNSSSFFSAFTSSRNRCTISSVCDWMCRTDFIGFNLAISALNRMVDRVTSRSSLVMRMWNTNLTNKMPNFYLINMSYVNQYHIKFWRPNYRFDRRKMFNLIY